MPPNSPPINTAAIAAKRMQLKPVSHNRGRDNVVLAQAPGPKKQNQNPELAIPGKKSYAEDRSCCHQRAATG